MSVADAAASGDRFKTLTAMRDHLAAALDQAGPRDAPALARQLRDVLAELDARPVEGAVDDVDELAARRADRRAGATGS